MGMRGRGHVPRYETLYTSQHSENCMFTAILWNVDSFKQLVGRYIYLHTQPRFILNDDAGCVLTYILLLSGVFSLTNCTLSSGGKLVLIKLFDLGRYLHRKLTDKIPDS